MVVPRPRGVHGVYQLLSGDRHLVAWLRVRAAREPLPALPRGQRDRHALLHLPVRDGVLLRRRMLGTPDETNWPGVSQLPDYSPLYPKFPMRSIVKQVPALDQEGADLLSVAHGEGM